MKTFKEAKKEVLETLGTRDYHSEHDNVAALLVLADAIREFSENLTNAIYNQNGK